MSPRLALVADFFKRLWCRFLLTRWGIRFLFGLRRPIKALKVLKIRLYRKPLVRWYYRQMDCAPSPCMAVLRTTNECNLRCVHCGQWGERGVFNRSSQNRSAELTTDAFKNLIANLASVCPHIYFYGGEPFLRRDLLQLVNFAASKNIITGLNTNGTLLKGKAAQIVMSGLDYINVSIDGPKEINDQIRIGIRDGSALVTAGIEELVRVRKQLRQCFPLIEIHMTVTEKNYSHIVETAALARALGVDYFQVALAVFTTPELAMESTRQFEQDFGFTPSFYHAFVRDVSAINPGVVEAQIKEVRSMWGSRYKQIPPGSISIAQYFHAPATSLKREPCANPWMTMQIMANGDMVFCVDFADLIAGNIRNEDPLRLWNNSISRAWRNRIRTKGIFMAESRCCAYFLQYKS